MKKICAFFEQDNDSDTVDYYKLVGALYPAKEMSKLEKEADQIENEVKTLANFFWYECFHDSSYKCNYFLVTIRSFFFSNSFSIIIFWNVRFSSYQNRTKT